MTPEPPARFTERPFAATPASEIRRLLDEGRPVDAQALLAQHPELILDKSLALNLAYEDYCQRQEAGDSPAREEFCARFPRYQSSLRRLLAAHDCLRESPELLAEWQQAPWPQVGQQFLGFTLLRELGRGSFARVFLADEPALGGRQVVLKIARHGAGEAQTLGRLSHPHIVPVHSVQADDRSGFTVICMPYLGSATLCDVLDRTYLTARPPTSARVLVEVLEAATLPEERSAESRPPQRYRKGSYVDAVVGIARDLADALAFAHGRGIYHRDLKPSNVLLAADGRPMLLDFNLAFDQGATGNPFGGTLPYMAPEQLRASDSDCPADPALVGARSDLFALGVVLYELLAGRHPFADLLSTASIREARVELLERQRRGPSSLRALNPLVDRGLARTVERCLAFDPAQRPSSAGELAHELRRSLSLRRRAGRWARGHRAVVTVAALVVLLVGCLVGHWWWTRPPYGDRQRQAGQVCLREGKYPEAVDHFNRALELEPRSPSLLFSRALAYQRQAEWRLAMMDFEAALLIKEDTRFLAGAGYCFCRLRMYNEGAGCFDRAVRMGFASPENLNNLGFCFLHQGKEAEARETLDRAIARAPHLQAPVYNRALLHLRIVQRRPKTDPTEGLADFRRALEIGPVTVDILWRSAILASETGHLDLALERLRQAIDVGEDPERLKTDMGIRALHQTAGFQALVRSSQGKPKGTPIRAERLLDPLKDLSP